MSVFLCLNLFMVQPNASHKGLRIYHRHVLCRVLKKLGYLKRLHWFTFYVKQSAIVQINKYSPLTYKTQLTELYPYPDILTSLSTEIISVRWVAVFVINRELNTALG